MLDAVSRLIPEEGLRLSTNKIAEVAGVSVGSLYRYFTDRDAIVEAWVEKVVKARVKRVRDIVLASGDKTLPDTLALLIDGAIDVRRGTGFETSLVTALTRFGPSDLVRTVDVELISLLSTMLKEHAAETRPLDLELSAFVLLNAIRSVITVAVYVPGLLDDPRLRAELVRLGVAYVSPVP